MMPLRIYCALVGAGLAIVGLLVIEDDDANPTYRAVDLGMILVGAIGLVMAIAPWVHR